MKQRIIVERPDGKKFAVVVDAPDGVSMNELVAVAQQRMAGYAPIPEVTGYGPGLQPITGVRETPVARTPWEAAKVSTAGEAAKFGPGFKSLVFRDKEAKQKLRRLEAEQAERFEDFPVSSMVGQVAPYLATPQSMVANLPRAAATGASFAGITSGGDLLQTTLGGLTGGLGYGLGRMLARPQGSLTEFQKRSLQTGEDLGFKVTPAQRTGSPALERMEKSMESSPLMVSTLAPTAEKNQELLNRYAAEAIGEAGDQIDDMVLGRAADRIGSVFETVGARTRAPIDDALINQLAEIEQQALGSIVKTDARVELPKVINNLMDAAEDGVLTGAQVNKFTSDLKKQARSIYRGQTGDVSLADGYLAIADSLDDLLIRNAREADYQRLLDARRQWRNLIDLERANVIKTGGVDPVALNRVFLRERKGEYRRGGRQGTGTPTDRLYGATRFGSAFRPAFGSSGTAERLSLPLMGRNALAGTMLTGEPASGILLGLGAPYVGSRLYGRWPWATGGLGLPASVGPVAGSAGARASYGLMPNLMPGLLEIIGQEEE